MNLAKVRQSIDNLRKIRDIIDVSKFSVIMEMNKVAKVASTALEMSLVAKQIFRVASEKYNITSKIYNTIKHTGKIFVYVTLDKTLLSENYNGLNKKIINLFDHETDKLITLGNPAIEFANEHKIEPIYSSNKIKDEETKVAIVISKLYSTVKYTKVIVVYNAPEVENSFATILPISEVNFHNNQDYDIKSNTKFYPSLQNSLDILSNVYLARTIFAIIGEAKYNSLKEKIIKHEQSSKSLDDKINSKLMAYRKASRKKQTEELILITSNSKRKILKNEFEEDERTKDE